MLTTEILGLLHTPPRGLGLDSRPRLARLCTEDEPTIETFRARLGPHRDPVVIQRLWTWTSCGVP